MLNRMRNTFIWVVLWGVAGLVACSPVPAATLADLSAPKAKATEVAVAVADLSPETGGGDDGAPLATPVGGGTGSLVFVSDRNGPWDLYLLTLGVDPNAPGVVERLTASETYEWSPVWSPDGQRLAYYSDVNGNVDLFMLSTETGFGVPERLTDHSGYDADPAWSPDGQALVFMSDRDGNPELYTLRLGEYLPTRLTDSPAIDTLPDWSALLGGYIAFVSDRDGNPEIYVMPAMAGAVPLRLTFDAGDDLYPAWSPDGLWLAFSSNRAGNADIYVLDVMKALRGEGTTPIRVTSATSNEWYPAWSADGQWLSFVAQDGENANLFTLPTTLVIGSAAANDVRVPDLSRYAPFWLTRNPLGDVAPAWQP